MSLEEVNVEGTLKEDGTLELDEKPALPPGRVHVMLSAVPGSQEKPSESIVDFIARIRHESEARGHQFLTAKEIDKWMEELRADDSRIEELYRKPS